MMNRRIAFKSKKSSLLKNANKRARLKQPKKNKDLSELEEALDHQEYMEQVVTNFETDSKRVSMNSQLISASFIEKYSMLEDDMSKLIGQLEHEKLKNAKIAALYKKYMVKNKEIMRLLKHCQSERNELHNMLKHMKASRANESKKAKHEIDEMSAEYSKIMSERDFVLKEIEALQEKLAKTQDMFKECISKTIYVDAANKDAYDNAFNESKCMPIGNQLLDTAVRLNTRTSVNNLSELEKDEPNEAKIYASDMQTERVVNLQVQNEQLNKRLEQVVAERDRAIRERESIRALCDDLRHQRDKNLSDLVESLRECEDLKKHKVMADEKIIQLELQVNVLEEKLISYKQLTNHRKPSAQEASEQEEGEDDDEAEFRFRSEKCPLDSQNSSSNLRQLKYEIEIDKDEELGIEFGYAEPTDLLPELKSHSTSDLNHKLRGVLSRSSSLASSSYNKNAKKRAESTDCLNINQEEALELDHNGIFIKHVYEHSNAYGKLKSHDQLIKIDDVDLRSTNLEEFQSIVLNLDGLVNFTVLRQFDKTWTFMDKSNERNLVSSESSKSIRISRLNNQDEKSSSTISNKSDFKRAETKSFELRDVDTHSSTFLLQNKYNYGHKKENRLIAVTLDTIESLSLETSIYISAIRTKSKSSNSSLGSSSHHVSTNHDLALLSVGDRVVSINGFSLANKSLLEIRNLLANFEHFNMVIEKKSQQVSMSSLLLSKSLISIDSSKMSEKRSSIRTVDSRTRDTSERIGEKSTTPSSTCDEELMSKKTRDKDENDRATNSKSNRFKYPLSRFHVPPMYTANEHSETSSTSDTNDEQQQHAQKRFEREKNKATYELDELIKNFRQCNKERNLMDKH